MIPKITIYDKYMFKQVTLTSLVAVLLFSIVWIAPEILLNTIKGALEGNYGLKTAILLLVYELPKILDKAFPVGLLLGTLFTFDKMSKDSEITIFRAVGMSFPRIVAPVVVLSLIFTYLCFFTGNIGTPRAEAKKHILHGHINLSFYEGMPSTNFHVFEYRQLENEFYYLIYQKTPSLLFFPIPFRIDDNLHL